LLILTLSFYSQLASEGKMVPEPVTITFVALRTVGVVGQAITSCIGIYKGWKLTQKFGDDYSVTWRNFQIQCARLEQISRRKLDFLKSKLDPYNAGDPTTNAVLKQLSVLEFHFSKCIKLMAKYEKPSKSHCSFGPALAGLIFESRN
jgi:hypothetical protein